MRQGLRVAEDPGRSPCGTPDVPAEHEREHDLPPCCAAACAIQAEKHRAEERLLLELIEDPLGHVLLAIKARNIIRKESLLLYEVRDALRREECALHRKESLLRVREELLAEERAFLRARLASLASL